MTREEAQEIVMREHADHLGLVLQTTSLSGRVGSPDVQREDLRADPNDMYLVMVLHTPRDVLFNFTVMDWLDPIWRVQVLRVPEAHTRGTIYDAEIFGKPINFRTGNREDVAWSVTPFTYSEAVSSAWLHGRRQPAAAEPLPVVQEAPIQAFSEGPWEEDEI